MTTSRSPRPHPLAPSAAATPGTLATTTAPATATADAGTARSGGSSATPGAALPYHRLAHLTRASSRWWRPLAIALVALACYGVILSLFVGPLILLSTFVPGFPSPTATLDDARNPMDILAGFGSLALLLPLLILVGRYVGGRNARRASGSIHSVAGRFRWGLFGRAAAVIAPLYAVVLIGGQLLLHRTELSLPPVTFSILLVYVFAVLLVPLQSAAEEYAFRALPMQALGTWLRSPLWGILLPIPVFVFGHGYGWVGQIDMAIFALTMGIITWKTGGIEMAVLLHAVNNLALVLIAPMIPSLLQQGGESPWVLLASVTPKIVLLVGLWIWVSRREGVGLWEPVRGRGRLGGRLG